MAVVVHPSRTRPAISGFTLIELMIVVVVIAVLSLIALPAYTSYVQKSRRAEAITLLNRIAQEQERWRANNPAYTNDLSAAGVNVTDPGSGYYTLAVSGAASSSYMATATAAGAQLGDTRCTQLMLTMAVGNVSYAASSSTGTDTSTTCWSR
jgi:type IV pilus assembly protein PilE